MICLSGCKCLLFFGKNYKPGLLRVKYSAFREILFGAGLIFMTVSEQERIVAENYRLSHRLHTTWKMLDQEHHNATTF